MSGIKLSKGAMLLFLTFIFSLEVSSKVVSLKELVAYSFKNSPDIQNQMLTLDQSELDVLNARISFFPSLDFSTQQGLEGGSTTEPDPDTTSELGLSLSETLYNNGTFLRNLNISKLQKKSSLLSLREQKLIKTLSIVRIYYDYLNSLENLEITKQQVNLLEDQFDSISNQYKQGMQTRIDYLRFKSRLQRSKLDLAENQVFIKNKIEELKRAVGWRGENLLLEESPLIKKQKLELPKFDIEELVENHRLYKISKLNTNVQEINIKEVNATRWPVISLESNVTYSGSDYLKGTSEYRESDSTSWNALVKLSWNLWDWGLRKNRTFQARFEKEKLQHLEFDQALKLRQDIKTLRNNMEQLSQNLSLSLELKKLEETNYKSLERDYRNGRTDYLNLINALNDLASAQRAYFQNYYRLIQLLYEYYYHEGTIIEKIS